MFKPLPFVCNRNFSRVITRSLSASIEEAHRQCELFLLEKERQQESIGRIEKIQVNYNGPPENTTMVMNKNISTPYDCAKHLGEKFLERSAVALINNTTLWHMHKPLPDNCNVELLHFHIQQPALVNKTFWRTCSFLLGAMASNAFKDKVSVMLHSFPSPNVKSGSFVHDIQLSLNNWTPKESELRVLSIEMLKFCQGNHPIECLDVDPEFALLLFKNNMHKSEQIPDIAANNNGKVTLFKADKHIDISKGPMLANTSQVGRFTVANVIKLDSDIKGDPIYRFQGVALPKAIILNHFAYGLLEERARKLNAARIPTSHNAHNEDHSFVAHATV